MKISVLIVTRSWNNNSDHLSYLNNLNKHSIELEVLVAEGNNPSSQRNQLASEAVGDYLLFLDDDSIPNTELLQIYYKVLQKYPEVKIMGGPSLLIDSKDFFCDITKIYFSTFFGIGPFVGRYNSIGVTRKSNEKDLILCNLLMERKFFLKTKGFSQELYPGEENEFLNNLSEDIEVTYVPEAVVYRNPRNSLRSFGTQMIQYGAGRAKHIKFKNQLEFMFLIPIGFTLYILSLLILDMKIKFIYLPLGLYFFIAFSVLVTKGKELKISQQFLLPVYFFIGHLSYGSGMIYGFLKYKSFRKFRAVKKNKINVHIHRLN